MTVSGTPPRVTVPSTGASSPARVISRVVLPAPLGPVTARRAPGGRSMWCSGPPQRVCIRCAIARRAAWRRPALARAPAGPAVRGRRRVRGGGAQRFCDRVSATAAPGNAVVASNADSGNSIRMATVVGARVADNADSRDDGAEHADAHRRGRNGRAESGRNGGAVERVRPIPLPLIGFRDHGGQPAADAQLRGVLERQHRRHVAVGMMGTRQLLLARRAPRRQPRREHAGHQQAAGEHGRGGR